MPRSAHNAIANDLRLIGLAIERTRWALLSEAIEAEGFDAADARRIALERARFPGSDTTARDHAGKLQSAGLLRAVRHPGHRLRYVTTDRGRLFFEHLAPLIGTRSSLQPRSSAEPQVLALLARADSSFYDCFRVADSEQFELLAALRREVRGTVRAHARLTIEPAPRSRRRQSASGDVK